jgi:transposase-like protein
VPARKHNVEEIVATLRQMERLTEGGLSVSAAAKSLGITDQTYYRWRTRYGSLPEDEAKRLQVLDDENTRLKRVIAEQSEDVSMLQDLTQGEIVSAARRREAVEYLKERYQVSERRACRLVGQHRSTQRYGGSGAEEHGLTNGTPTSYGDLDNGHGRAQAGQGQGWQAGVKEGERSWHGGGQAADEDGEGNHPGNGNGHGDGHGNGWANGSSYDDGRPLAPIRKLPFVDDRVPCFGRLRTSLIHDLVWLTRDSEVARFLAANPVIRHLEGLATAPQGLVQKVRGRGDAATG